MYRITCLQRRSWRFLNLTEVYTLNIERIKEMMHITGFSIRDQELHTTAFYCSCVFGARESHTVTWNQGNKKSRDPFLCEAHSYLPHLYPRSGSCAISTQQSALLFGHCSQEVPNDNQLSFSSYVPHSCRFLKTSKGFSHFYTPTAQVFV